MKKLSKKNKIILLVASILLVLLILIVIGVLISNHSTVEDDPSKITILPGIYDDPERVTVTNWNLNKEQCINNICVKNVKIVCYDNRGNITYKITNKGKETSSGYLKLAFETYTAIIIYDNLEPNKTMDGFTGYSGFDLRKEKSYELQKMKDTDYQIIVS